MGDWLKRQNYLIGAEKTALLAQKHVIVFGVGGVGGHAIEALARTGIGALTIVDFDRVAESNLNRQIIALHSTIGRYKVDVMEERLLDINPHMRLCKVNKRYTGDNRDEIFTEHYDFAVDAIDKVTNKLDLIQTALARGVPIISCMGTGGKLDPGLLKIADLSKTDICPLAKVMRKELRKREIRHLDVLFSTETPRKNHEMEEGADRPVPGSISFVPAAAGLLVAAHVVAKLLCEDAAEGENK